MTPLCLNPRNLFSYQSLPLILSTLALGKRGGSLSLHYLKLFRSPTLLDIAGLCYHINGWAALSAQYLCCAHHAAGPRAWRRSPRSRIRTSSVR